jgi:hypothetical protein
VILYLCFLLPGSAVTISDSDGISNSAAVHRVPSAVKEIPVPNLRETSAHSRFVTQSLNP